MLEKNPCVVKEIKQTYINWIAKLVKIMILIN